MIVVLLHLFPGHTSDRGSSFLKKEEHVHSSFRRLIYTRRNRLAQSSRLVGSRFQLSLVSHLFRIILKVFPRDMWISECENDNFGSHCLQVNIRSVKLCNCSRSTRFTHLCTPPSYVGLLLRCTFAWAPLPCDLSN